MTAAGAGTADMSQVKKKKKKKTAKQVGEDRQLDNGKKKKKITQRTKENLFIFLVKMLRPQLLLGDVLVGFSMVLTSLSQWKTSMERLPGCIFPAFRGKAES